MLFGLLLCGVLQADIIQVNKQTFRAPDLSGFARVSDKAGIKEMFPLVEQDYRHITHFTIYEETESENPIIGRFTTPTRSVGARIKPRKEFISEILSFKYDEDAAAKLRASFEEAQNILKTSEENIDVESINEGLLSPVIVDHDEYGFYSAQSVKGTKEGIEFHQASMTASTVIKNTFFILYVTKEFEGAHTHKELLEVSKKFTAQLVRLNEK